MANYGITFTASREAEVEAARTFLQETAGVEFFEAPTGLGGFLTEFTVQTASFKAIRKVVKWVKANG